MGLLSEEKEALYAELNKKLDAAISYSVTGVFFYHIFILCLWLEIIRRSNQGV